jgi:hypothetical protein
MKPSVLATGIVALAAMALAWHFKSVRNMDILEMNQLTRNLVTLQQRERESRRQSEFAQISASSYVSPIKKAEANWVGMNPTNDEVSRARSNVYQKVSESIRYGPLFRALGLSLTQIDQFLDNKQRYEANISDIYASLAAQGLSRTDPAGQKLMQEASDEYAEAQTGLLGAPGAAQASQFEMLIPAHESVDDLNGEATLEGVPLSSDQLAALTTLISDALLAGTNGKFARSLGDLDWSTIDAAAQSFLSPTQFKLFTTTEPPGPGGTGTSRFLHQMTSLVTAGAKADSSAGRH